MRSIHTDVRAGQPWQYFGVIILYKLCWDCNSVELQAMLLSPLGIALTLSEMGLSQRQSQMVRVDDHNAT
jgi:hypothetical protein